ncbi:tetratricopeptide repeat protein [Rubrobacter tropicus]|uniref:Tetratricopeptide repeat protein n=1 Tax=Rubrobacter tropicus TaxID=2653851 RepID=A0A6G8QCS0_9ACTN|nr:tetratricopeptide repeat protein [Rubrobacter tropicus]QIN84279.1 tetratricopeptide repeat protein [Rubrobacter tropicus]
MAVCRPHGEHKGQGLLLRLGGAEGNVVLTCHHVVAAVEREDLRVRIPSADGTLGEPVGVTYDEQRSNPERDAAVLRVRKDANPVASAMPLLHELDSDTYEGSLKATVLTHLMPNSFDAMVRLGTMIDRRADPAARWPEVPERYRVRAFRLASATYSKPGFSGGVVFCEGGVLGLAHFGRRETEEQAREDYLVPLSEWAEGWPALNDAIEPLVDRKLKGSATVRRAAHLSAGLAADVTVAGYRPEVYSEREVDRLARRTLEERGGVVVVGRPLSGKSRLVVELLREDPRAVLVVPRLDSQAPPESFEASGFRGLDVVLLFDDLHYTARSSRPLAWVQAFEEATGRRCKVVCTSRDGAEWSTLEAEQQLLLEFLGKEEAKVFTSRVEGSRRVTGEDLSEEQGWELAQDLGIGMAEFDRRFDGTPGSLLLDLDEMGRRYRSLRDEHRGGVSMGRLLDSAKILLRARHLGFSHDLVRAVAERVRGRTPMDEETWEALIRRTREEGFAQLDEESGSIRYYTPYLERCVDYEPRPADLHVLETLLQEQKDGLGLFALVAVYGEDLRDPERALSCAEKALELNPDSAGTWYNESYALNGMGRFEESLSAIERALSLDPGYHPAYYSKGFALSGLKRYREAAEAFREAIRLGQGTHEGIVSMYFHGLGNALADQGLFYEAVWATMQSLHLYPPYKPAPRLLRRLLLGEARLHGFALEVCDFLLSQDSEWAEAWCAKGHVFREMDRQKEALAAYERAIGIQPSLTEAWAGKSLALLETSDSARGSDKLAKYLTEQGANEVANDLASRGLEALDKAINLGENTLGNYSNRAVMLSRLDRDREALQAHNVAVDFDPGSTQALHNRGMVHVKMRHYGDALRDFREAVRLDPDFAPSWWQIASLASGHFDEQWEALFAAEQAIRLRPGDAASWFAKGCIYTKLGRPDLARFWFRCAKSHGTLKRWSLLGGPSGGRLSFFDFAGPVEPCPDKRYRSIGSPTVDPMQAMRNCFLLTLGPKHQDVMRALKLLAFASIAEPTYRQLRAVLESNRLFGLEGIELGDLLNTLARQAFVNLAPGQNRVRPEYACLWEAVSYRTGRRIEQDLDALSEVFYTELADHEALSQLSGAYAQAVRDYAAALACADRAIALKPDYAPAWGNRSAALGNMGRDAEALEAIEEAGRLSSGHPTASYNRAVALNKLGRHTDALAVFDEMVGIWPDNPDVVFGRAEALAGLGRKSEAAAEAVRAGELRPIDPDLALREGLTLLGYGNHEGALRAVDRALSINSENHIAFFVKATALMAADRKDEAVAWHLQAWSMRHRFPDEGAMIAEMLGDLGHDPQQEES